MRKSAQNDSSNGGPDVALDGALEVAFFSAIEYTTEALSQGTPKGVLQDLYEYVPEHSMLHLKPHLRFSFLGAYKNVQKCEEKNIFYAAVYDPLDSAIKGAPEIALEVARSNILKNALEVAFEVALKLHLLLHLLMQSLMHKCVQNVSSNGGLNAVLEGALYEGFNVIIERES